MRPAHVLRLRIVRDHEHQVVTQRPQGRSFRALARVDALDQLGDGLHRRADGDGVIGRHDELRPSVPDLVRHVEGSPGEGRHLEHAAAEDLADAVVQMRPGLARVHVPLRAPDDLAQVGLGEKAHRGARPIVEIGGLRDELPARFLDEAHVHGRTQDRVAELLRRESLQRVVEREGVHQDRPRDVSRTGRHPAVVHRVDLLRERTLVLRPGRHVAGDRRGEGGLLQARHDLLADRLVARVDVVEMDRGGVRGPLRPQVRDGAREKPQHAAHALEVGKRRGLAGQRLQHLRMQGIAREERLRGLGAGGLGGERCPVRRPQAPVGVDHGRDLRLVDLLEQAPAQDLDRLVLLGRIEQGRLARRHALRLRHPVGDELALLAVGIGSPAVLADRQRIDQRRIRRALHRLEQRGQEGGELVAGAVEAAYLAQIHRELVEQDEDRLAAEELPQGPGAGRHLALVARAHPFVAFPPGEGVCHLAPGRMSQHAFAHRPSVGRIGVLPVEGRDAHGSGRYQRRLDELRGVRDALHPARRVHQRDQPVGLAPAVGGVEAEDRGGLAACAGEAPAHVGEQVPKSPGRVGMGEEAHGVQVLRSAPARDDLRQVRREVGLRDRSPEDVVARTRGLEDRRDGHGFRFALPCAVIRPDRARSGIGCDAGEIRRLRGAGVV